MDQSAQEMIERVVRDKDQPVAVREAGASALQATAPRQFEAGAQEIVIADQDDDDLRAAVLAKLAHQDTTQERPEFAGRVASARDGRDVSPRLREAAEHYIERRTDASGGTAPRTSSSCWPPWRPYAPAACRLRRWSVCCPTGLELLATLRWLGHLPKPVADDLSAVVERGSELSRTVRAALTDLLQTFPDDGPVTETAILEVSPAALRGVVVEGQNGERSAVVDALSGRPTVLAFFYTRCDNPYKCSLTVTKMARLQQRLRDVGRADAIGLVLVSYDPEYDTPPRLSRYAAARSPEHRLFRAAEGHDQLRAAFALRVGYGRTLVNRHGLEAQVTGPDAGIARTWARVAWDIDEVAATALGLL